MFPGGRAEELIITKEINMRHANQIRAGAVKVGMQFRYVGGAFVAGEYVRTEKIATVATVRVTKTGRVNFTTEGGGNWANAPIAPTSWLQK